MSELGHRRLKTFVAALVGVAIFWVANLPLPFLFGPMAAGLVLALSGVRLAGFGQVSTAARTILGLAVGCSLTPEVIVEVPKMAGSLALIPLFVLAIVLVGVPYFRHVCGFDRVTAYYAAVPGGLQDMIIFGQEAGGNPRTLSLVQATRVLIIVTLAPIVLTTVYGSGLSNPMGAPAADLPLDQVAILLAAALLGWKIAERIGLFGASIIGPIILSGALTLGGVIHSRPPVEAVVAAQFFIGSGIAAHYVGVTWQELRQVVLASLPFALILAILAALFAYAATALGLAPPTEAFLAFAPGGQAEMTVLAIVSGADLGFIIAHHLTRILVVVLGAPIAAKWLGAGSNTK